MIATESPIGQPKMDANTTAGAARIVPQDMPREMQEQECGEGPGLRVEATLEVFVRGVHLRAVQKWHEGDTDDHHREREPEIELDESKAIGRALRGGPDHRDGGQLCGHDREADCPPGQAPAREEISLDPGGPPRTPNAVYPDVGEINDDDDPVERVHEARSGRVVRLEQPEQQDRSDLNRHHANQRRAKRRGRRRWRLSRARHLGMGQVAGLMRARGAGHSIRSCIPQARLLDGPGTNPDDVKFSRPVVSHPFSFAL